MLVPAGKVVIIGAGEVGSTYAYAMLIYGTAREIVLVDIDNERACGQASDLSHGQFFTPPVNIRAGNYEDCKGANIVAITAGAKQKPGQSRMDLVNTNVQICKDIVENVTRYTTDAILLVVTNPVDVLTYAALHFSGLPRERVIGSGTVLDSARFRYFLSEHCKVNAHNVHAYVLGEHGDSEIMAWSMTTVGGTPFEEYCKVCPLNCPGVNREEMAGKVRDSAYHIIEAKGATNFAVGLALIRITTSILRNEDSVLAVSTLLKGEYGIENVCLSVPAVLDWNGVDRWICPPLPEDELKGLRASAEAIRKIQHQIALT